MSLDTKEDMRKVFISNEIPEFPQENDTVTSYYMTEEEIRKIPKDTQNIDILRIKLSEYYSRNFKSYAEFENQCDIKRNTFQKMLKFKNGRNVTYVMLAKFAIGAELSFSEANELFTLMGRPLDYENYQFDYILKCNLEKKCDIAEFGKDVKEYCNRNIFTEAD